MGFMDRIIGTPEARAAHREAREHLDEVSRRDREETDEFLDANNRVIETEKDLPRWRRG
ncbi:hypothetical protein GCM10010400_75030 [Streptomyces aculeolatus]|uniref:hypothetical protein n=1 Tax=Streptomyces aculeolatus TaxID=270689 RepID=UPI001CECB8B1|nr:hypothetical protein [Streptomyces aculeolatus]